MEFRTPSICNLCALRFVIYSRRIKSRQPLFFVQTFHVHTGYRVPGTSRRINMYNLCTPLILNPALPIVKKLTK